MEGGSVSTEMQMIKSSVRRVRESSWGVSVGWGLNARTEKKNTGGLRSGHVLGSWESLRIWRPLLTIQEIQSQHKPCTLQRVQIFFSKCLWKELCGSPVWETPQHISPELGSSHCLRNMRWLATDGKGSMLWEAHGNCSQMRVKQEPCLPSLTFSGMHGTFSRSAAIAVAVPLVQCYLHLPSAVTENTHVASPWCSGFAVLRYIRRGEGPGVRLEKEAEVTLGRSYVGTM